MMTKFGSLGEILGKSKKSLITHLDNIVGILVSDHQTNGGAAEYVETSVNTSCFFLTKCRKFGLVNENHLHLVDTPL